MPGTEKQRGRGRPRKDPAQGTGGKDAAQGTGKRPRGRPRKPLLPPAEDSITSSDSGDAVPTRQEPEVCSKMDLSRIQQLFDVDEDDDGVDEAAGMEKMDDLRALIHEPTVDAAVSLPVIDRSNAFPFGNSTVSVPHPISQGPVPTLDMRSAFPVGNSTVNLPHGPMTVSNAFPFGNSTVGLPHPMPQGPMPTFDRSNAFHVGNSTGSLPHGPMPGSNAFPFGNSTVSLPPHPFSQGPMPTLDRSSAFPVGNSTVSLPHGLMPVSNTFHFGNSTVSLPHPMSQGPVPTLDRSSAFPFGNSTVSLPHGPMPVNNALPVWDLHPHAPTPTFDLSNAFAGGEVAETLPQFMSARQRPSSDIDCRNWGSLSNAFPGGFASWLQEENGGQFERPVAPLVVEPLAVKELAMEILPAIDSSESAENLASDSKRDSPEETTTAGAGTAIIATKRPREAAVSVREEPAEKNGDSLVSDSIRPRKGVSPEASTGNAGNAVITTKRSRFPPRKYPEMVRAEPEVCDKWDLACFQQLFAERYDDEVAVTEKEDGHKFEPEPAMEDPSTMDSSEKNSAGYFVPDSITKKNPRGRPRKRVSPESVTEMEDGYKLAPEPSVVVEDPSRMDSSEKNSSGHFVSDSITKKRPRGRPRKEVSPESVTGNAGDAVTTKKRPRGRPRKEVAVMVREEPEDFNNLDPARLDEVAAMFMVNGNFSEPPVVNNAVSLHWKPSSNNDIANGVSIDFAERYHDEVTVMEKHDEVAVMEKVDNCSEPPVDVNNAVSLHHIPSNDDIANGVSTGFAEGYHDKVTPVMEKNDEVAVIEKVDDYSEPPVDLNNVVSLHQKPSNNDVANGGSTGFAEGYHDEVTVMEKHDEVAVIEKVDDSSEPPVHVNNAVSLQHLMSEAQNPPSEMNNDIDNGGSTGVAEGYHDEVTVMEKHDEVAVMEKMDNYSVPPVDVNDDVSSAHLMSELQKLSSDIQDDIFNGGPTSFAGGWQDEVAVVQKVVDPPVDVTNAVSLQHLMSEDREPLSRVNNDGGSTGLEDEAEGYHDVAAVNECSEPIAVEVNNGVSEVPHFTSEDQEPIVDISTWDSTGSLPNLMFEDDQYRSSVMNNEIVDGVSTIFAKGYHDEAAAVQKVIEYSEPTGDVNDAVVSVSHEDQMLADDISIWDYTVSEPHLMCEDQRPSSDMNNDIASGGLIADLHDQKLAMDMCEEQRPSSDMNDEYITEDQWPSTDISNDFANRGSSVNLPADQEAMYIHEDQRPSSDVNNDFANGGATVHLPNQEAMYRCEDPSMSIDSGNGGSSVELPDQEATDNAFPDSDPILNDFGNGGLLDQVAMENTLPVESLPDENQDNHLEHVVPAIKYETPEVLCVEPWGFNVGPLDFNRLLSGFLRRNEETNYTDIEDDDIHDIELSPIWNFER